MKHFNLQFAVTLLLAALFFSISAQAQDYTLSTDPNDVHFYLFPDQNDTSNFEEISFNETSSLENSRFDPRLKTVFITHGFRSDISSDMPQTVKNAFLAANLGYNVIVVSWGALATPLPVEVQPKYYPQVTKNVPVVAERVADFIIWLRQRQALSYSLDNLYLVGHSLGAHVSGLTGRFILRKTMRRIPRITGLDPAGPLYYPPNPERNLRPTNAEYVDVIHTNMFTLGDSFRDGHADFYPNGGVTQPTCVQEGDYNDPVTRGRCSHWFAYRLFAASLTKSFPACQCPSPFLLTFYQGMCSATCRNPVQLGYWSSPKARGEYYLVTSNPP